MTSSVKPDEIVNPKGKTRKSTYRCASLTCITCMTRITCITWNQSMLAHLKISPLGAFPISWLVETSCREMQRRRRSTRSRPDFLDAPLHQPFMMTGRTSTTSSYWWYSTWCWCCWTRHTIMSRLFIFKVNIKRDYIKSLHDFLILSVGVLFPLFWPG